MTVASSGSYVKMFVRRLPALKTLMLNVSHPWEAVEQMHVNLNSMTAWENRCNVSMKLCFALYNDEIYCLKIFPQPCSGEGLDRPLCCIFCCIERGNRAI